MGRAGRLNRRRRVLFRGIVRREHWRQHRAEAKRDEQESPDHGPPIGQEPTKLSLP
jgi:hypothetical protein